MEYTTDLVSIWNNMQLHHQLLSRKRLFLMGLTESEEAETSKPKPRNNHDGSFLPESFLRKDDVFYEDIKDLVEKGFGGCDSKSGQKIIHDDLELHNLRYLSKVVLALLDDLSNNGLYCLATIISKGSVVNLEKTRSHMKKVIKKSLIEMQSNQSNDDCRVEIRNQVSQLLKNPEIFRQNYVHKSSLTMKSHRGAIMKVLNGLEDLPTHTLDAMHRKLRGKHRYVPKLDPPRSGWNRDRLINRVRKLCLDLIYQLRESDKLQAPLAKAMNVAVLSSKLASGVHDRSMPTFFYVTPDVEALQNQIVKAIHSLGRRMKKEELRNLRELLDPESRVDGRGLKTAINNMLTQCLYECSDMDEIPDSLLDALSIINKTSFNLRRYFSKDVINEEVECILNVGAQTRQILWDNYLGEELDIDYADAFMEELEESDEGDLLDDDDEQLLDTFREVHIGMDDSSEEVQSTGFTAMVSSENSEESCSSSSEATRHIDDGCLNAEISGAEFLDSASSGSSFSPRDSPASPVHGNDPEMQDHEKKTTGDPLSPAVSPILNPKQNSMSEYQKITKNQYVAFQEVCDQASVSAYQLVGHVLAEFGQMEETGLDWDDASYLRGGLSTPEQYGDPAAKSKDKDVSAAIIIQAVKEVLPSFSSSELEMVEKFMTS